jgi:hypothetical protein
VSIVVVDQDLKYIKQAFDLRCRSHRRMSINLGEGNCQWTTPMRSAPTEVDFHKNFDCRVSLGVSVTFDLCRWTPWLCNDLLISIVQGYTHGLDTVRGTGWAPNPKWSR